VKPLALLLISATMVQPAVHRFAVHSPNFRAGGPLPASAEYNGSGCHGSNRAPRLTWSGAPRGLRSYALTVVDPDAPVSGGWVHWVLYNIPRTAAGLTPAVVRASAAGTNSFGFRGYGGPCPPPGDPPHHYVFTVYALSVARLHGAGLTRPALLSAIKGHTLATARLVGTFKRS
jgi:Raf kinase inhibitor-like YbhB/YbcL family protein